MPSKIIFERFLWFHDHIKTGRYPNAKTLSERFEITPKTAQRDIEFMRERLGSPFRYVPARRGYEYEDDTWELPGLWFNEDELISLVLSYRLASAVPDTQVKEALRTFLNAVIARRGGADVGIEALSDKISVKNIAYARTHEGIFHRLLEALLKSRSVRIEYNSPHDGKTSVRDILPLHLLAYMGTWHVIAHCHVKQDLRDFVLSRIKSISPGESDVCADIPVADLKAYIRKTFGIFRGKRTTTVCLRFAADIAPWIAEQSWHPSQQTVLEKDGRLQLNVPVADLREIKREVLRYGGQVEVVSPAELRQEVKKEIEKMRKVYWKS